LLLEEVVLVDDAINAPNMPWVKNYSDSPGLRPENKPGKKPEPEVNVEEVKQDPKEEAR